MRETGESTQQEFKERKEEVDVLIATMKISLTEAGTDQFDFETVVSYATQFIGDLHRQWADLPPSTLPRFQKLVFPDEITPKQLTGVGTVRLGLIFELCRNPVAKISTNVP